MAINLRSTSTAALDGLKVLVYGSSGSGKTTLIGTLPNPLIISAEAGLLSLSHLDIPYIDVSDMASLREAYEFASGSKEASKFDSIAIDSISEIAEVVLSAEKKATKDGRAAYGNLAEQMTEIIRAFRDLSHKHVYMSAKMEKLQDESGRILYGPSMPGTKLGQQLAYFFDECFALRVEKDEEGKPQRALMCDSDGLWSAKDRSGKLSPWEEADLSFIINKISGVTK
jgi:phage nucleotide-binding protein